MTLFSGLFIIKQSNNPYKKQYCNNKKHVRNIDAGEKILCIFHSDLILSVKINETINPNIPYFIPSEIREINK